MQVGCQFCRELKSKNINSKGVLIEDAILWENRHFSLTLNIGSFVQGYTLLIPKKHIPGFSYLTRDEWDAFYEFRSNVLPQISSIFGPLILFEHGGSYNDIGSNCIQHAHLHIVPYNKSIVSNHSFGWQEICTIEEIYEFVISGKAYLLYEYDKKFFVKSCDDNCSQFFRKLLVNQMGIKGDLWNWRKYSFVENMIQTKEILKNSLI